MAKAFAIVLEPYYSGDLCEGDEDGTHEYHDDIAGWGRGCIAHGCQGQPWVLGIYTSREDARADLLPMARRICPKGFDHYNTLVLGVHRGGSYDGKTDQELEQHNDFVLLRDDILYGSNLSIEEADAEELDARAALVRGWAEEGGMLDNSGHFVLRQSEDA